MAFPGNQYKLLALDLDGTLLNEKNQVSPRDAQAVRRAQERGVQIVLCTGRNVREVRAFSDQLLAPPGLARHLSGAAVQRPQDAEPQFFSSLSLTHCEEILSRSARNLRPTPACIPRSRCTTAAHSARSCAIWSRADRSS